MAVLCKVDLLLYDLRGLVSRVPVLKARYPRLNFLWRYMKDSLAMCGFLFWGALLEQLPGTKDRIPCALIGFVCASLQGLQAYQHLYAFVRHSRRNYLHYGGHMLLLKPSQMLYIQYRFLGIIFESISKLCIVFGLRASSGQPAFPYQALLLPGDS